MRPVHRGPSPRPTDYDEYRDAFGELVSRIGMYCSYCERRVSPNLAVEHIQPKGLPQYAQLRGRWDNFLLGCSNCNSTKGDKDVVLSDVLLPDRDNTMAAYVYTQDGKIEMQAGLDDATRDMAANTLKLTGLDMDKPNSRVLDANGQLVAADRLRQRKEMWLIARASKQDLQANPTDAFRRQIARTALGHGFFSIWMAVFSDDVTVRKLLIQAFAGTAVDCFDPITTSVISPRPANGLADAGKV